MSNKVPFYELLYENETLYKVSEPVKMDQVEIVVPEPIKQFEIIVEKKIAEPTQQLIAPSISHQVLVLTDEFSPSDAVFLDKVLKAVGLSLESVDVMKLEGAKQIDFKPELRAKKIHHFMSFGVPFLKVNLDIMMNRYDIKVIRGINFLFADPLAVIQEDDKLKRALWGCLKTIFTQ